MPATPTMPATKFRPHLTISDHIGAYSAPICRGHGPLLRRKGPRPTKAISSSANPWPVVYTLPAVDRGRRCKRQLDASIKESASD